MATERNIKPLPVACLSLVEIVKDEGDSVTVAVAHMEDQNPIAVLCNEIAVGPSCELRCLGRLPEHYVAVGLQPLQSAGKMLDGRRRAVK